jgi:hypothetical protein
MDTIGTEALYEAHIKSCRDMSKDMSNAMAKALESDTKKRMTWYHGGKQSEMLEAASNTAWEEVEKSLDRCNGFMHKIAEEV